MSVYTRPVPVIRDATPKDALEVARVHIRAWQVAYRGLLPDALLDALRAEERAREYSFYSALDPQAPHTILALEDGAVSGFASIGRSRDRDAPALGEVRAMYVDPPRWRRGVGRALMTEAQARLHEQGFAEAILWVLADNQGARSFYRSTSWTPDGRRRHKHMAGVTVEEVRFRCSLA